MFDMVILPRAVKEIENAMAFYAFYSYSAPLAFVNSLEAALNALKENPFYAIRDKNVRSYQLKRLPDTLFVTVSETKNTIKILTCFHNKRSPNKRPQL
jgi:toxin ParE1/3/4